MARASWLSMASLPMNSLRSASATTACRKSCFMARAFTSCLPRAGQITKTRAKSCAIFESLRNSWCASKKSGNPGDTSRDLYESFSTDCATRAGPSGRKTRGHRHAGDESPRPNECVAQRARVAAEEASFGQNFAKVGLFPDFGGTYFLPQLVGPAKAAELFYTGDMIDAKTALRLGIVNHVVPAAQLETEVKNLAQKIAQGPSL